MSAEQYVAMTFVQLKQECQKRGLDTGGSKDHLVKRLLGGTGGAPTSPVHSPASSAVSSPASQSPASSASFPKPAAKFGAPSPTAESPTPKATVSWKDEPKASHVSSPSAASATPVSTQSKFLQDAEKRRREAEAEIERQRQEDSLSRFALERVEKQKQEEVDRRRRDEQQRQQEEEQRQRDEANRRKQQEESDKRRQHEEEQRKQNEEQQRRRQQEEVDQQRSRKAAEEADSKRRQEEEKRHRDEQERRRHAEQQEQERHRQHDEQEKKRLRDEEHRAAELREKQTAELKKVGDTAVRNAMAESQRLEAETIRMHDEAKRKAEHAKTVQEEARRKEEEARKLTEESRKLTEEAKQCYEQYRKLEEQAKAARRAVTEAQKKGEDDARKAAEANIIATRKAQEDSARKAQEERDRSAATERQAADAKRREEERRQQQLHQEENRKREELERKREEEARRARDEERKKAMDSSTTSEKKRTIEIFESDSDEEENKGSTRTNANGNSKAQDPALAALVEQRNRSRLNKAATHGGSASAPTSPAVPRDVVTSNPNTPSPEEQRRKLMASKPLPAAPKSAPTTPQQDRDREPAPPKMSVDVAVMGGSDSDEGSNGPESSRDRGTTPRGLRPFAKVAWYLRDWEWNSKDEIGQSEDEPSLVQSLRREYKGDMFWLICENTDDARKLTRHVPEAQKMLETSSGFYDASLLMIQQGKKVFFLCSRDLACTHFVSSRAQKLTDIVCIRKSCTYIEDSMRDPRYRGHGIALRNKMIDRLEELQDFYPREDQDAMADAVDFDDEPRAGSGSGGAPPGLQRGHTRNKSLGEKLALTPEDKEAIKGMKDQAGKALTTGLDRTKTGLKSIVSSLK